MTTGHRPRQRLSCLSPILRRQPPPHVPSGMTAGAKTGPPLRVRRLQRAAMTVDTMTRASSRGRTKFLLTRTVTGIAAVGVFVSLWAGVTAQAQSVPVKTAAANPASVAATATPIIKDGWRWDPAAKKWILLASSKPAATASPVATPTEQIVYVERQPIIYKYVTIPAASAPSTNQASSAPAAGSSSAPAQAPAATVYVPASTPAPSLPSIPSAPAAVAPPQAQAPVAVATQPPAPPPMPAAPPPQPASAPAKTSGAS